MRIVNLRRMKRINKSKHIPFYFYRIPSPASMTVEASLVLPVFLFAMLIIAYTGDAYPNSGRSKNTMTRIVNEASAEAGAGIEKTAASALYYRGKLELYMGGTGLSTSLLGSSFLEKNDEIDMIVSYSVRLPFNLFGIINPRFKERVHSRAFVGVDKGETPKQDDMIVYITDTGRVYHMDKNCTYLKPSVSQITFDDIELKRNRSGGKYKACARCAKGVAVGGGSFVWITNYGDRYHTNRACTEITRSIKEVKLSEVGSRTPCSKCGYLH